MNRLNNIHEVCGGFQMSELQSTVKFLTAKNCTRPQFWGNFYPGKKRFGNVRQVFLSCTTIYGMNAMFVLMFWGMTVYELDFSLFYLLV